MKRNLIIFVSLIFLSIMISSCSGTHPYVGKKVYYNPQYWCVPTSLPKSCQQNGEYFIFNFTIKESGVPDEYTIEGIADCTQGKLKSWTHLVPSQCKFGFLIANKNIIIDYVSFRLLGDYIGKLPFKATFKSTGFDAITAIGNFSVKG